LPVALRFDTAWAVSCPSHHIKINVCYREILASAGDPSSTFKYLLV
jgi:hypothetical protein